MRVTIDKDKCTGHGRCYMLSPTLFQDDDQGYGQVAGDGHVTAALEGEAMRAQIGCPESAVLFDRRE